MASIELPLPHDPADYEPKAVAGKFSYRAFATIVAVVASEIPLILRLVSLGMDELPNTSTIVILAAIPAALIALIGLSRREGLYFESWFPPLVRELMTPTTILPAEALPTPEETPRTSKADARAMRAERPVLERDSAALLAMLVRGNEVRGIAPAKESQERPKIVALAPELLVEGRMTFLGIKPRKARKLRKRGVDLVPTDLVRSSEVSSHKWVSKRLARLACRSAAEVADLIGPFDVQREEDVLHVLAAHGIDATSDQVEVTWPVSKAHETVAEDVKVAATDDPLTPSPKDLAEDTKPAQGDNESAKEDEAQEEQDPTQGLKQSHREAKLIPVDSIFGVPGERSMLSRKAYKALVKAGVEEVEVDPTATAGDLQARYGICPRAAEELKDAIERLTNVEELTRQENE